MTSQSKKRPSPAPSPSLASSPIVYDRLVTTPVLVTNISDNRQLRQVQFYLVDTRDNRHLAATGTGNTSSHYSYTNEHGFPYLRCKAKIDVNEWAHRIIEKSKQGAGLGEVGKQKQQTAKKARLSGAGPKKTRGPMGSVPFPPNVMNEESIGLLLDVFALQDELDDDEVEALSARVNCSTEVVTHIFSQWRLAVKAAITFARIRSKKDVEEGGEEVEKQGTGRGKEKEKQQKQKEEGKRQRKQQPLPKQPKQNQNSDGAVVGKIAGTRSASKQQEKEPVLQDYEEPVVLNGGTKTSTRPVEKKEERVKSRARSAHKLDGAKRFGAVVSTHRSPASAQHRIDDQEQNIPPPVETDKSKESKQKSAQEEKNKGSKNTTTEIAFTHPIDNVTAIQILDENDKLYRMEDNETPTTTVSVDGGLRPFPFVPEDEEEWTMQNARLIASGIRDPKYVTL